MSAGAGAVAHVVHTVLPIGSQLVEAERRRIRGLIEQQKRQERERLRVEAEQWMDSQADPQPVSSPALPTSPTTHAVGPSSAPLLPSVAACARPCACRMRCWPVTGL